MVEPPRFVIVESRSQDKTQKLRGAPVPAAGRGQQGDNQQYCQQDSRAHRASTSGCGADPVGQPEDPIGHQDKAEGQGDGDARLEDGL